jgi:hypothetical protein
MIGSIFWEKKHVWQHILGETKIVNTFWEKNMIDSTFWEKNMIGSTFWEKT